MEPRRDRDLFPILFGMVTTALLIALGCLLALRVAGGSNMPADHYVMVRAQEGALALTGCLALAVGIWVGWVMGERGY